MKVLFSFSHFVKFLFGILHLYILGQKKMASLFLAVEI